MLAFLTGLAIVLLAVMTAMAATMIGCLVFPGLKERLYGRRRTRAGMRIGPSRA